MRRRTATLINHAVSLYESRLSAAPKIIPASLRNVSARARTRTRGGLGTQQHNANANRRAFSRPLPLGNSRVCVFITTHGLALEPRNPRRDPNSTRPSKKQTVRAVLHGRARAPWAGSSSWPLCAAKVRGEGPPLSKISQAAGRVYEYWHVGERAFRAGAHKGER